MESNTGAGLVFDVGSLYARFEELKDKRKRRGVRYRLAVILVLGVMAKICGENHPVGIAEWAKHRSEMLAGLLKVKREKMPDHRTYGRIFADVVSVGEVGRLSSGYFSRKEYFCQ